MRLQKPPTFLNGVYNKYSSSLPGEFQSNIFVRILILTLARDLLSESFATAAVAGTLESEFFYQSEGESKRKRENQKKRIRFLLDFPHFSVSLGLHIICMF